MALTLVSTTASERLLRHVQSLSEAEAEDVLRLLVCRREQAMSKHRTRELDRTMCDSGRFSQELKSVAVQTDVMDSQQRRI